MMVRILCRGIQCRGNPILGPISTVGMGRDGGEIAPREPGGGYMINPTEEKLSVAGVALVMLKGGSGKPLLLFHDELRYPGWMSWNEPLGHDRTLLIPLQPGYGKSPRLEWVRSY